MIAAIVTMDKTMPATPIPNFLDLIPRTNPAIEKPKAMKPNGHSKNRPTTSLNKAIKPKTKDKTPLFLIDSSKGL